MGWAYGIVDGREVGYSVEAVCDEPGCEASIDRGLAYACGNDHGAGEDFCERYFCGEHLFFMERGPRCGECSAIGGNQ